MSMNIHLEAVMEGTLIPDNEDVKPHRVRQSDYFECLQTPTKVTYVILESSDPKAAYTEWVLMNFGEDEIGDVYDFNVSMDEPVGTKVVNFGKDHIEELERWINYHEKRGWNIKWFDM